MNRKFGRKEKIVIGATIGLVVTVATTIIAARYIKQTNVAKNYEVTESEIQKYKDMIGSSMDVKKSVLIMFESADECKTFIENYGSDENPQDCGNGTIPYMPDGYYNIVGKPKLEEVFDSLGDGEYTKEPVEYSGMYCYLKRIGIQSVIQDDEEIKKIILEDRAARTKIN